MTLAERIEKLFNEMVAQAYYYKVGDRVQAKNSNHPLKIYQVIDIHPETGGLTLVDEITGEKVEITEEEAGQMGVEKVKVQQKHGLFR